MHPVQTQPRSHATRIARRSLLLALLLPAAAMANPRHLGEGPHYDPLHACPWPPFGFHDAMVIQQYYGFLAANGRCPPDLVRTGGGCQPVAPPVRWQIGQPLPEGAQPQPLPAELMVQLYPPYDCYYVRVGPDILVIAREGQIVCDGMPGLVR